MNNERQIRLNQLLKPIRDKRIFLYGAGKRGRAALENLRLLGMHELVVGFVDDVADDEHYLDKHLYGISDITEDDRKNAVFIITTYAIKNMSVKLMRAGVNTENILYFSELLIDDIDTGVLKRHVTEIKSVYTNLSDDFSRFIYKSVFEIYLSGNVSVLSRTKGKSQYFPVWGGYEDYIEDFVLSDDEVFVDCGAYIGDTTDVFIDAVNNKFNKIICFEPDDANLKILEEKYGKRKNVKIYPYGAYSRDGQIGFSSGRGTSSEISEEGTNVIEVRKIDTVIPADERVSFIKMDIEGAEQEALKGAESTIKRNNPNLAICIYHRLEDLWEIPLLIKSIRDDYKIYIRNYEDRLDEMVCYAIKSKD